MFQSTSTIEMEDMTPAPAENGTIGDFNQLITSLRNENEVEFSKGFNFIVESNPSQLPELFQAIDDNNSLLTLACEKGLRTAVEDMLRFNADINAAIDTARGPLTPIECACHFGNWEVLDLLLKSPKLDLCRSRPLLSIVVKNIGKKETVKCNYDKCFKLLLDYKHIEIDQLDKYGCSPLFYAVKFNNTDAILELLKRGAYIGQKNIYNRFPISNISREVLEKHFDSCIKTNNLRAGEEEYEIQFDYSSLVPVSIRLQNAKKPDDECSKTIDGSVNEMTAIDFIAKSNELRQLMKHPLITSFLFLKWNQYALMFYMNFILSVLFALSNTVFILLSSNYYQRHEEMGFILTLLRLMSLMLTFYIIVREMSQLGLSPWTYFRNVENYVECAMIALVVIVLLDFNGPERPVFAASSLVLIGIEMVHLAGSLPFGSFSTHYVMLKKVISTFLKSISHYAIPFFVFSSAFIILLRTNPTLEIDKEQPIKFKDIQGEFKDFLSIIKFITTMVFIIIGNRGLGLTVLSCFFFISFIIPTVFLNLLNGLAVNDIQAIKSQAELTNFIYRCQVLTRYERTLLENEHWCR